LLVVVVVVVVVLNRSRIILPYVPQSLNGLKYNNQRVEIHPADSMLLERVNIFLLPALDQRIACTISYVPMSTK
jgi:hypothetical protein